MKRYTKNLLAFLLAITIILSSALPIFEIDLNAASQPSKYSTSYNSGKRDVVCTTLNGTSAASYYTGSYTYDSLAKQSSSALFNSLQTLMRRTHTSTSSYNDCHYKADRTDCQNGDGSVSLIYTAYSATMKQWNGWNREHVWPQSLGGGNTTGGGADLHHIRPSDAGVNSTRGNKPYGNVGSGAREKYGSNPAVGVLGGTYNSTYFEPLDNVKGDVARICLYVYVRWNSDWGATSITKVFQSIDVLLEWCELDPVDTWEMGRNEVVGSIQGNRNVFIDYPELAWLMFGEEIPSDMTTPSGKAASGSTGGGSTGGSTGGGSTGGSTGGGSTGETCTHTDTVVKNATSATCGASGYTGDTYCEDCGVKISSGSTLPATGNHAWDSPVVTQQPTESACGYQKQTCTVCGATKTTVIPALSVDSCIHATTVVLNKVDATCGESGYTGDTYCGKCGEKLQDGESVPATGEHSWDSGVIIEQPTTSSGGTMKHTCEICSAEKIVEIAAISLDVYEILTTVESDTERILILIMLGIFDESFYNAIS